MPTLNVRGKLLRCAVVALAVALTSAVGGCGSSGPATDGPLSSAENGRTPQGANCAPGGELQSFGTERFTNYGHVTVVLDRVALLHPQNERLVGSYAVPGIWLIGVVPWPPRYAGIPATWAHRQPVHGFRLAPGQSFDMVLGVAAAAAGQASSEGMLVYYHDSAGSYLTTDHVAMIVAATSNGCQ
ncbi:MAG TPA: hypothetical protein VEL03_02065 [Streptosporangiaceae bacterium]|nr:hypothetical protein [Streptosporangiaceae bacterium]